MLTSFIKESPEIPLIDVGVCEDSIANERKNTDERKNVFILQEI